MSFLSVKKIAYVLSFLIMSCYTFSVNAAEPAPVAVTTPNVTGAVPSTPGGAVQESVAVTTPNVTGVVPSTPGGAVQESVAVTTPNVTGAVPSTPGGAVQESAKPALSLNSERQKYAYASGIMLGQYIEKQIELQQALHITLDKDALLAGIADTFNHQEKMSIQDVQATLTALDRQIKVMMHAEEDKRVTSEKIFIEEFAKRPGVRKTPKGLYYQIEEKGDGAVIKDTNQVEVTYKGELIDGTLIDGPKIDNSNEIFRVAKMPVVLRDSVKLISKGGRIKIVIPPVAVKSNNASAKQNGVVVIYTISVVNVNSKQ